MTTATNVIEVTDLPGPETTPTVNAFSPDSSRWVRMNVRGAEKFVRALAQELGIVERHGLTSFEERGGNDPQGTILLHERSVGVGLLVADLAREYSAVGVWWRMAPSVQSSNNPQGRPRAVLVLEFAPTGDEHPLARAVVERLGGMVSNNVRVMQNPDLQGKPPGMFAVDATALEPAARRARVVIRFNVGAGVFGFKLDVAGPFDPRTGEPIHHPHSVTAG